MTAFFTALLPRNGGALAGSRRRTEEETLAVGERRLAEMRRRRTVAGAPAEDRDCVADLDRHVLLPARPRQHVRRIALQRPGNDLAAVVPHVEIQMRVRVPPVHFRDDAGELHGFVGVEVHAEGMMSGDWNCDGGYERDNQEGSCHCRTPTHRGTEAPSRCSVPSVTSVSRCVVLAATRRLQ